MVMRVRRSGDDRGGLGLNFWCPGCEEIHGVWVSRAVHPVWTWNGSLERPTLQPSILVTSGHYMTHHKPGAPCWCTHNAEHPDDAWFNCSRCHSFVTDGRIQFLGDCSHKLAGQTVDLPDVEYRLHPRDRAVAGIALLPTS